MGSLMDKFVARDEDGNELARKQLLYSGMFTVKDPSICNYLEDKSCEMPKLPWPTDPEVLKRREKEDALRLSMLKNQPSTITHYTPTGFAKTKCPRALWQALRGYFDVNKRHAKIEHWHDWQIFTSQYDAQALHTPILEGDFLKPRLNAIIQPMLSAWAGGVNLEPTAMYGVRAYTRGAWLKNHVDMRGTHIISAIVNIDQDVDEPWPLEIRDHAGQLHNITMVPGDIIMYEGATCEHGRQYPLNGRWLANTFIHFKVLP